MPKPVKEDLENLKKEIVGEDESALKVTEVNILFLDVSSTCTGYSIASVNFETGQTRLKKTGALWLNGKNWDHGDKYLYIHQAISNYFWIVEAIDYIVVEQYSLNPKKMGGVLVVPEMMGAIKTAAKEHGIKVDSILPQTWRSQLNVKPDVTYDKNGKKKRDWKEPTKQEVLTRMSIPDKCISNMTGNERTTPSDVYDSIGVCLGWLKKIGLDKVNCSKVEFNTHLGVINQ